MRWKRWLGKLHRFTGIIAAAFLMCFCADLLIGIPTWGLRLASGITGALAVMLFAVDAALTWLVRPDRIGLAHLLEKSHPELAERLVTLVQLPEGERSSAFAQMLQAETEPMLTEVDAREACPLVKERRTLLRSAAIMTGVFVGLCFLPAFSSFTERYFSAWVTPVVPFTIEGTNGYALRGGNCQVEVQIYLHDLRAEMPTSCELVCQSESGEVTGVPMTTGEAGRFVVTFDDVNQPLRCVAKAGGLESTPFAVTLVDAPVFKAAPELIVSPPAYMKNRPKPIALEDGNRGTIEIVRYSKIRVSLPLDRMPARARLRIKSLAEGADGTGEAVTVVEVQQGPDGRPQSADVVAEKVGVHRAELALDLEHGLTTTLPLGRWIVRADAAPRFTQTLRLHGATLLSSQEYRVAPGDLLKLQTAIEDNEGLGAINFEYSVNDDAPRVEKWLNAAGKKTLAINDWLPLPGTLKEGDRIRFRVHAADNRDLKKGEVQQSPTVLPPLDLAPNITIAPSDGAAWISLRVDRSVEDFLKQQAKAQGDEVRDVIEKIRQKVQSEIDQVVPMQRAIHQQTALTPAQIKQAESLRAFNREIAVDLLAAGERFGANPELAKLAEHFLDIAEHEMMKSGEALQRFTEKDRPLADAQKDLQAAHDELRQAAKKLDRLVDWNNFVTQDRLDQFQLDKLAKRQNALAERLQKLLDDQPPSDADLARQIEAIRDEQAKLAEQAAQLQDQNRLVQDSLQAMQQERAKQLAEEAANLAAEQKALREKEAASLPAEVKAKLDDLAKRQAELAGRVQPFAQKNNGPDVKPAQTAADALRKPNLDDAIAQQKEHERRLQEWLAKIPLGAAGSLREQVLGLAKRQKQIRADVVKFGRELAGLNDAMIKERLRDLVARQKEMPGAIAKLPIDAKQEAVRSVQKRAEQTARQAGDQLAVKDALSAFESMEKVEQDLDAVARLLPQTAPIDLKDPAVRAKIDQVEAFAREQQKLRAEAERLRSDAVKASAGAGKSPLAEKADKLASELMELSQKSAGPEAKAMAKESAEAVEAAKKAMAAAQDMKAKGNAEEAKKMDDDAQKQLAFAVKQLDKLTQDQPKTMPKDADKKTAEALNDASVQMKKAEKNLPAQPKDAQAAMQSAAKSLELASKQAGQQSARKLPKASRNPAASAAGAAGSGGPRSLPKDFGRDAFTGKSWGELPGELKTRMLQDLRARFGAEYAETIRQYFDSLNETTPAKRGEAK
ncbi:MAG: hypothetical protein HY289_01165 [Planctomycetes bacterium]|nr:hypothetical protein [Planctomycetota bacterium]